MASIAFTSSLLSMTSLESLASTSSLSVHASRRQRRQAVASRHPQRIAGRAPHHRAAAIDGLRQRWPPLAFFFV